MFDVSPLAGMVVGPDGTGSADPHRLFLNICHENNVAPSLVRGQRRDAWLVTIRRQVARVLRDAGCSLPEIGRILGGRHHTTVMVYLEEYNLRRLPRAV